MGKTSEQMDQERRVAKAKQRAASNAKKTSGQINQQFCLSDAAKDKAKRAYATAQSAAEMERKGKDTVHTLYTVGAVRIDQLDFSRFTDWQVLCVKVIDAIRGDKAFSYNADWRQTKLFLAGRHH